MTSPASAVSRWWEEQVVPRVTDRVLATGEVHKLRARVCAGLAGEVVEIGFGSGLNARHYPAAVERVLAVEPSDVAWELAERRHLAETGIPVVRAGLDGEAIGLPDASVDSALSTFSLCTIPHPTAAVAELRRVLRPGGSFHFLEHGLASDQRVVRWQNRLTPVQRRLAGGCHLNRPITNVIEEGGLAVEELDRFYVAWPKSAGSVYLGRAFKR